MFLISVSTIIINDLGGREAVQNYSVKELQDIVDRIWLDKELDLAVKNGELVLIIENGEVFYKLLPKDSS